MKQLLLSVLIVFSQTGFAQPSVLFESSFTESTTEQEKFSIYLDSIVKYLYGDTHLTELSMAECQKIIDKGVSLPDSLHFDYVLQKIYVSHSKANPIGAFEIIANTESALDSMNLTSKRIGSFNYLKGFTFMSIGDLESAQKTYYENIEFAKAAKDTSSLISTYYSLGQLYHDEKDFQGAVKSLEQALEYAEKKVKIASTKTLVYMELSESYVEIGEIEKAKKSLQMASEIAEENYLDVLKVDILIRKGEIYLSENNTISARAVYNEILKATKGSMDSFVARDTKIFQASLNRAEKKYGIALSIYESILAETDSTDTYNLMSALTNAHEISNEMQDHETAYDYLLSYNRVKQKSDEDEKKQKTSYLKIKFDSEQQEKENEILAAEVLQNKTKSKLLYLWLALLGSGLVILFGAFYQKGKYSKRLEKEVLKRTVNLKKSNERLNQTNKELKEFNRIVSHDLKEPLRSVVGFGQLAKRENIENEKVREYLSYIISGGEQLEDLITSINIFQKVDQINISKIETINVNSLLVNTLEVVEENYPDKEIELDCNSNFTIFGNREILKSVFEIIIANSTIYNENKLVEINVKYYLKNEKHCLEFKDNGIGVSENYHQLIFEMFKRLNNRSSYKGAGMGLSIAQKMIERIDGEITILESKENEGSTFLIQFPQSEKSKNRLMEKAAYQ